jgi:hypothetical protein
VTANGELEAGRVRELLDRIDASWAQVRDRGPVVVRRVRIAEVDVEIAIAGEELAAALLPPFTDHPPALSETAAVVGAWDALATGIGYPPRPPVEVPGRCRYVLRRDDQPIGEVEWPAQGAVRTGDLDRGLHLLAVDDAASSAVARWEVGSPLRRQLSWALGPDALFVHAAVVGEPTGVAMVMGPSGAGKSTTSLACLRAGMGFLGDDYCIVRGSPPVAHRLYSSARLLDDDVRHFDDFLEPTSLGAAAPDPDFPDVTKALFLLRSDGPQRLLDSAPVRMVLVPERGDGKPSIEPMRVTEALRSVAPSSLWQMSIAPEQELAALARLLTSVPCYRLRLSPDRAANPEVIREALAHA